MIHDTCVIRLARSVEWAYRPESNGAREAVQRHRCWWPFRITTMQRVTSDRPYSCLQSRARFVSHGCQSAPVAILQDLLATLKSAAELELSNARRDGSNGAGVASCSSVAREMDSVERSRTRRQSRRMSDAKDSAPTRRARDAYRSSVLFCTERDGSVLKGREALDTREARHQKQTSTFLTDPLGDGDAGDRVDALPWPERAAEAGRSLEGSAVILGDRALAEAAQGSGAEGAGEVRRSSANGVSVGDTTGSEEVNTRDDGGDSATAGSSVTVAAERKSAAAAKAHELAAAKFAGMKIAAEAKSADTASAGSPNPRGSLAGECVAHPVVEPVLFLKVYG